MQSLGLLYQRIKHLVAVCINPAKNYFCVRIF